MLIGWMVVYIISCVAVFKIRMDFLTSAFRYPIYSFFLPLYSFWCMDEFGWGNTRVVLDDGKNKKVVGGDANEIMFNESMIPYKKWSGQRCC